MFEIAELKKIIESFRQLEHFELEGDCYFTCPLHPDYCGSPEYIECECGLVENNKKVDRALELITIRTYK